MDMKTIQAMTPGTHRLSLTLQLLAGVLEEFTQEHGGDGTSFALVVAVNDRKGDGSSMQYVSNMVRDDAAGALQELLDRWKAGMADIPAHENPETPDDK